jgi:hypothetical protein
MKPNSVRKGRDNYGLNLGITSRASENSAIAACSRDPKVVAKFVSTLTGLPQLHLLLQHLPQGKKKYTTLHLRLNILYMRSQNRC